MQIGVSNGVAGWVKYGEFPRGVRTENFIKDYGMSIPTKLESETIPIFTDVRRDAEAGFGAAGEWAKFRTMAVACSDFVLGSLKKEDKSFRDMPRESQEERNVKYNANELLRSRIEFVAPLMISLLPNTMLRNGQGTLRGYYKPGVLEGALALELEKGVNPNFGRTDEPRPISGIDGAPIDISPTGRKGEYDALLRFRLHVYMPGLENNETAREVVQSNLEKYFNVGVHDSSNIFFTMHIPKANRVYQELLQGANDTIIHKQSAAIIDAVREVSSSAKYWKDMQMPVLEQGYKAMVKAGISEHFGRLEQAFNRRQSIQRL